MSKEEKKLRNGSSIAVVGGGPAGSFFSFFILDFARILGLSIQVDIFEAKDFGCTGPKGCNHCGGILSESLVQHLAAEGIVLPDNVIRRGIQSYTMHLEQGVTVIDTPLEEQRIVSMFRGLGPLGSEGMEQRSFDQYLLDLALAKGARLVHDQVTELRRRTNGIEVYARRTQSNVYDLVVGSTGLNKQSFDLFKKSADTFKPPKVTRTYICEFKLDQEVIDRYLSNSMHVFLLNQPKIKFGALIPKRNFVTLVLLGEGLVNEDAERFIRSDQVKACFPPEFDYQSLITCRCRPEINMGGTKEPFDDHLVMVGDMGSSKLYKNGLGAAYLTAKAAARTSIFSGIAKENFKKEYERVCRNLDWDNTIGKLIFLVTALIQKSNFLKKGLLSMIISEQKKGTMDRKMSSILWDTFTGSASYRNIFGRVVHPRILITLAGHMIQRIFKPLKI